MIDRINYINRHYPGMLEKMEKAKIQPYYGLGNVASEFGISRERVRQFFLQIFGVPFQLFSKEKTIRIHGHSDSMGCKSNPLNKVALYKGGNVKSGAESEVMVLRTCTNIGYIVSPLKDRSCDLLINGYVVDVKSTSKPTASPGSIEKYYRIHWTKKQHNLCDFILCHLKDSDQFYIIPPLAFPSRSIYIPLRDLGRSNSSYSKYEKYRNAWDLMDCHK